MLVTGEASVKRNSLHPCASQGAVCRGWAVESACNLNCYRASCFQLSGVSPCCALSLPSFLILTTPSCTSQSNFTAPHKHSRRSLFARKHCFKLTINSKTWAPLNSLNVTWITPPLSLKYQTTDSVQLPAWTTLRDVHQRRWSHLGRCLRIFSLLRHFIRGSRRNHFFQGSLLHVLFNIRD